VNAAPRLADLAAVVLAGGSSTRMGSDKALLPFDGVPLIERLVRGLQPHFAEVLVSARRADDYAFLGVPVVPDPQPGLGPMRGVASALAAARHDPVFFTPCDQAEVPLALAAYLLDRLGDADGVVPCHPDGKLEPLLVVLRRRLAPALEAALRAGERRIIDVYERSAVAFAAWPAHLAPTNLNTRADYLAALTRRRGPDTV